ncbi:MAG: response regulator [bacterium]|nr:response regulator [bacterium]
MRSKKPILLVEDDKVDAMTVKRSLREIHVAKQLDLAGNGEEALQYLRSSSHDCPCIILLGLNMSKMNGIEFLQIIRHEAGLRRIPVIVLTTSKNEKDKIERYHS